MSIQTGIKTMSEDPLDRLQAILEPLRPQSRQALSTGGACGCNQTARGLSASTATTTRKREVSMATQTIEILPKTSLIVAMTQSPEQAIDLGDFKTGLLQAWVDIVTAGDSVRLDVQQSNVNEDGAFEDVAGMTLSVTQSFGGPGGRLSLGVEGRYIRLKITPDYGVNPITSINVRAVLHLNRD